MPTEAEYRNTIHVIGKLAYVHLTGGYVAKIDWHNASRVGQHRWFARVIRRKDGTVQNVYAQANAPIEGGKRRTILLHRYIASAEDGDIVDHINGVGLDCVEFNLRLATPTGNACNRKVRADNLLGVKGVSFRPRSGSWQARIMVAGKAKYLGTFSHMDDAVAAYAAASAALHGEFGRPK